MLQPPTVELDDPRAYGRSFSETYDSWYSTVTDAEATAGFVAARANGGVVLELGSGTGRLAVAMSALDLTVIGLDASMPMLGQCPAEIHRLMADMAQPPIRSGASVTALCGFNTLFNLTSQYRQAMMFRQLRPIAKTLILETAELGPPGPDPDPVEVPETQVSVRNHNDDSVVITTTSTPPDSHLDAQTVVGAHIEITNSGVVTRPWMLRWVTVDQLDDMATRAGFQLTERYSSWDETPWPDSATSPMAAGSMAGVAVSVYR